MPTLKPYSKGNALYRLRQGKCLDFNPHNPHLIRARDQRDLLLTLPELKDSTVFSDQNRARPLVIEFGCYYGQTLVEMAHANGEYYFLGVENKYKRAVKSVLNIRKHALSNAAVIIADGRELLVSLPDHSVAGMVIFFPDPWLKPSQWKHRLVNAEFLKTARDKLVGDGFLWVKTDQQLYLGRIIEMALSLKFIVAPSLEDRLATQDYSSFFNTLFQQGERKVFETLLIRP